MTPRDPIESPTSGWDPLSPVSAAPLAPEDDTDVAGRGWGALTVRVAWTLTVHGVAVKPDVLRDAREHVLHHLDPSISIREAEDLAEPLTAMFVARARGRAWADPFADDREIPLSPRWRARLHRGLSRNAAFVLRMHHADGHPLETVAKRLGEDPLAVEAAREGLREVLRRVAAADEVSLDGWPDARVDALLHRLATMAPDKGPDLLEVVDGLHPDHLAACPRSARAHHLVRTQTLRRQDLVSPEGTARPIDRVRVLALHFHPDGKRHRAALAKELTVARFPVGDDLLLVDLRNEADARRVIDLACELGRPMRDHLRGALLEGPGRWSRHGLLGPLVDEAASAVRAVPWGTLDGVGELPAALPPPPSARRVWAAVAVASMVASLVMNFALRPDDAHVDHPLTVTSVSARQGVWLDFDVDDMAYVALLRVQGSQIDVLLDGSNVADKARYSTGDGGFRLHAVGDGLVVASASEPIQNLPTIVASAHASADPLAAIEEKLREVSDSIDVDVVRADRTVASR
jgi:hypothetical protein